MYALVLDLYEYLLFCGHN